MAEEVKCKMEGCDGKIDLEKKVILQTGCSSSSLFFACGACGRVHSVNGDLIFNRPGASIYLREDGFVDYVNEASFEIGKKYRTNRPLYVCIEPADLQDEVDDDPEWVDLGEETHLVFDGMSEDQMYRFHDESGIKYRLDLGDAVGVDKEVMPIDFVVGNTYKAKCHIHACMEGKDGDCLFTDQVELVQGTALTFDGYEDGKYRFHTNDETAYHLHNNDIEDVEEVK